jgi:hypothetical protein
MEYELKKPLQVYNKEKGEYEAENTIVVSFKGKKGLQTIKRLQDVIFKTFAEQAKKETPKENKKESGEPIKVDEVFDILEMTGQSEKLFDEVVNSLKVFGEVGNIKLKDDLIDEIDIDDLDGLYQEVLKHFLLPKITSKMNSLSK